MHYPKLILLSLKHFSTMRYSSPEINENSLDQTDLTVLTVNMSLIKPVYITQICYHLILLTHDGLTSGFS